MTVWFRKIMMNRIFTGLTTALLFMIMGWPVAFGAEQDSTKSKGTKPDFEITGYGAAGYRFFDRDFLNNANKETYYQCKIQFDYSISKKIDAQFDFRANSLSNTLDLREYSVKLKYYDKFNIKFGQIKKPFGYEYMINQEELITAERSYMQKRTEELGYGGRNMSFMIYTKYDPDDSTDIPISYYFSVFNDNSLTQGIAGRFIYHFDGLGVGGSWLSQKKKASQEVVAHGFALELIHESKKLNYGMETYFTEDPYEKARKKIAGIDETQLAGGVRLFGSYKIKVDSSIVNYVEPMLHCCFFTSDIHNPLNHVFQVVAGTNIYLSKNALIRLNGDLMFTKNKFNKKFTTKESNAVIEMFVRL